MRVLLLVAVLIFAGLTALPTASAHGCGTFQVACNVSCQLTSGLCSATTALFGGIDSPRIGCEYSARNVCDALCNTSFFCHVAETYDNLVS